MKTIGFKLVLAGAAVFGGWQFTQESVKWVMQDVTEARAWVESKFTKEIIVEKPITVPAKRIDEILVDTAARHDVPVILLRALIEQESGANLRTDRVRYEPRLQKLFKRESWQTDMEYQAMASSWGLGQVIFGLWKQKCGLTSYSDLLDPAKNLDCSAKILNECMSRRQPRQQAFQAVQACLGEYNGDQSGQYSAQVLARLARIALEHEFEG